ncbi:SMI1/KNR4 family protein [Lentibacillus sp. Marseille-P4043]|uniref:SMI1/KNR4 family protein n=1 Tax=Lentibacillus sp. Marseille-P4043 TaxID=2040293 RepID=UPI000D0BAE3D|nr:SMI1/KNR4 family protein [Lentibacillus sp. Marseille-P4043]
MDEIIQKMINMYKEKGDFFGSVDQKRIESVETELGVTFPFQYKNFVSGYGSGGVCGVYILGIEGNEGTSVIETTKRYRELGLRDDLIVIEDLGEFVMCSETGNKENILDWDQVQKQESFRYENFDDYLIDTFQEAIDNWD